MISVKLLERPLLFSCLSICLLAGCSKSNEAAPEASKDEAKAEANKADAPADAPASKASAPKGKDAPGNLEPVVKAAMAAADCKFDEDNILSNDCKAVDELDEAVEAQGEAKLSAPTLINLLGESSDAVRWAAADQLARGGWQDDPALVGAVITALGTEKYIGVGERFTGPLREIDTKVLESALVIAAFEAALAGQTDAVIFEILLDPIYDCEAAACKGLFVHAAKHNSKLENRTPAAREIMNTSDLADDSCSVVAAVAIASSQAKPVDSEADFQPYEEASQLISDLRSVSIEDNGKTRDCAAELPKLLDEGLSQAKAGTLDGEVFYSLLDVDQREDKAQYMAKLEALAKAVEGNAKFEEDMRSTAKDALAGWKEG